MKTWTEEFQRTWLARQEVVSTLDDWVRATLQRHRPRATIETIAPWSVRDLVGCVNEFGQAGRWLSCVTAISILQELVFCAEDGGIDAVGVATDRDLRSDVTALRELRNVTCHPAFHLDRPNDPTPMTRMLAHFSADDDAAIVALAVRLPNAWSSFAEKPVAAYALRKIGSAGRLFMIKLGLWPRRFDERRAP